MPKRISIQEVDYKISMKLLKDALTQVSDSSRQTITTELTVQESRMKEYSKACSRLKVIYLALDNFQSFCYDQIEQVYEDRRNYDESSIVFRK